METSNINQNRNFKGLASVWLKVWKLRKRFVFQIFRLFWKPANTTEIINMAVRIFKMVTPKTSNQNF